MGAIYINNTVINQKQAPAIYEDVQAARPAAGYVGRLFVSTDLKQLQRDNGVTYDVIGGAGAGTITGGGTTGTLAIFTTPSQIGDSVITQAAGNINVAGNVTSNKFITAGGTAAQFVKGDGSLDNATYITSVGTLQQVTNNGNVTTLSIGALSFVKSGGTAAQFLKADGTVDGNTYLTAAVTSVSKIDANGFVWTITNPTTTPQFSITTNLAAGVIPFIGSSGALNGSISKVFWDNSGSLLGINTAFPNAVGDFRGSSNSTDPTTNDPLRTLGILNTSLTDGNIVVLRMASVDSNQLYVSGAELQTTFTGRSPGVLTGNFAIRINNAGTMTQKLGLSAAGALKLNAYTTGKYLVNDASGNITSNATIPYSDITGAPAGGVSSVNATDGSGFDFTVINNTTTPVISLTTQLTAKSVPFIGASGALVQDNTNFTFDSSVNRFQVNATNTFNSNTTYITSVGAAVINGTGFTNTVEIIVAGMHGVLGLQQSSGAVSFNTRSQAAAVVGRTFYNAAGGSVNTASAVASGFLFASAGSITNAAGFYSQAPYQQAGQTAYSGTITNYYGLYIDDISGNSDIAGRITNKFGIYQAGANDVNRFYGTSYFNKPVYLSPGVGSNAIQATCSGGAIAFFSSLANTNDYSGYWVVNGTLSGSITHPTVGTTNYNTSSDYRLKENVVPLAKGLDTVMKLRPVGGNYKADPDKTMMAMFLAHEVQQYIPIAVTGEKDAVSRGGVIKPQALDVSKMMPYVVAAIQELYNLIKK